MSDDKMLQNDVCRVQTESLLHVMVALATRKIQTRQCTSPLLSCHLLNTFCLAYTVFAMGLDAMRLSNKNRRSLSSAWNVVLNAK